MPTIKRHLCLFSLLVMILALAVAARGPQSRAQRSAIETYAITNARIDRMGSIEPGKTANIVVTDGDLLEVRTHVRHLLSTACSCR